MEILLDCIFGPKPHFTEAHYAKRMLPWLHPHQLPIMVYRSIFAVYAINFPMKNLIHELKFFKNKYALDVCTKLYASALHHIYMYIHQLHSMYSIKSHECSTNTALKFALCIIPLPMSKFRLRQKGYNQCELMCKSIVEYMKKFHSDIPIHYAPILTKIRRTPQQARLSRLQRLHSQKNSFYINQNLYKNFMFSTHNNIYIVIDDIVTTGSTLKEALRTLQHNTRPSDIVCGLALCHTLKNNHHRST